MRGWRRYTVCVLISRSIKGGLAVFDTILYDLEMTGCAMVLLAGAWLANMILGLYYNTTVSGETFDSKKLLSGALKLLTVAFGTALISVVVSVFPVYLTKYGIEIQEDAISTFSVIVIATIYAASIIKYIKECISKLTDILK